MVKIASTLVAKTPKTAWGVLGLIWRYKFWIFLLIVLAPTIYDSVKVAIDTQNPIYPFLQLGERILSADNVIAEDVELMRTNMDTLVGMAKPDSGIWQLTKYYWKFFINVIWKTIGNVWLIFFPLIILYKILRLRNVSEVSKNWMKATIYYFIFVLLVNAGYLIYYLGIGKLTLEFATNLTIYAKIWIITKYLLPFHGLFDLIKFLLM